MELPPRAVLSVLSGLSKKNFFAEEFSFEELIEGPYAQSGASVESAKGHILECEKILLKY